MKNEFKKKLATCSLCILGLSSLAITSAIASSDDNYAFSFRIQGSVDNAQDSTGRYRGTDDNSNAWKVNLKSSGEGSGTITDFWIERKSGRNASSQYHVKQGNGSYYFPANNNGDKVIVYLTGENNNFASTKQYSISGIWDPETGCHVST
jgi:hypothetical protein